MSDNELRGEVERLTKLNDGLSRQIIGMGAKLEEGRRELLATGWDAGFERGGHLAAWAIGNRPESERPNTENPYRKPVIDLSGAIICNVGDGQ